MEKKGELCEYENVLGEKVVLELIEKYRGKVHRIFCDNFFSLP